MIIGENPQPGLAGLAAIPALSGAIAVSAIILGSFRGAGAPYGLWPFSLPICGLIPLLILLGWRSIFGKKSLGSPTESGVTRALWIYLASVLLGLGYHTTSTFGPIALFMALFAPPFVVIVLPAYASISLLPKMQGKWAFVMFALPISIAASGAWLMSAVATRPAVQPILALSAVALALAAFSTILLVMLLGSRTPIFK